MGTKRRNSRVKDKEKCFTRKDGEADGKINWYTWSVGKRNRKAGVYSKGKRADLTCAQGKIEELKDILSRRETKISELEATSLKKWGIIQDISKGSNTQNEWNGQNYWGNKWKVVEV